MIPYASTSAVPQVSQTDIVLFLAFVSTPSVKRQCASLCATRRVQQFFRALLLPFYSYIHSCFRRCFDFLMKGTGKSHVAAACKALIECPNLFPRQQAQRILACAFQGRQASGIGATTIHSISNVSGTTTKLSSAKKQLWSKATVLIVEEVSMVAAPMYLALHNAAVAAHGEPTDEPFAGKHVIALGDFGQLDPVAATSLAYGFASTEGASRLATLPATAFAGQQLFLGMTAWVVLHQSNRFTGPLKGLVERLADGEGTQADADLLNSRVVDNIRVYGSDCHSSTLIGLRNNIRCRISVPLEETTSRRLRQVHYLSHAKDKLIGDTWKPWPRPPWPRGLRGYVQSLDDKKTRDMPLDTSLYIGMNVVLRLATQYTGAGVCNNSEGTVRQIVLDDRETWPPLHNEKGTVILTCPPAYVLVHVPEAEKKGVHLRGFPPGVVPIARDTRTFNVKIFAKKGVRERIFTIKRTQIPLSTAKISSVHRAQGETINDALMDLRQPRGDRSDKAIIYVAVSRVTRIEDIKLLFRVGLEQLQIKPNEDNKRLMAWIHRQYLRHKNSILGQDGDEDDSSSAHGNDTSCRPLPMWMPANNRNNCFFNCTIAYALAITDGVPTPPLLSLTPAGNSFFSNVAQVKLNMSYGPLQPAMLVSSWYSFFRRRARTFLRNLAGV